MEKEAERERLIKQLLNQTSMDKYNSKLGNDAIKNKIFHLTKELSVSETERAFKCLEKSFENTQISGSIAEGAVMVRNLKSNLPEEYIQTEVDFMCSPGKILKSRSRETIIDLPYAKGFAWIKYEPRWMELERLVKLDELVINHEDVTYLNSKAAKEFITDFKKVRPKHNTSSMPYNLGSLSKQIQGPS